MGLRNTYAIRGVDPTDKLPYDCSRCGQGFDKTPGGPVLVICDGKCGEVFCAPSTQEWEESPDESLKYCCFMPDGSGNPKDGEEWFCAKCNGGVKPLDSLAPPPMG